MHEPSTRPAPCFIAAPEPFEDESPASWVQRLGGAHQYSLARLARITQISPSSSDWDCGVADNDWTKLMAMSAIAKDACGEARYGIKVLRDRLPKQKQFLHDNGKPSYRWCPACIASDAVPYLRWEWRLLAVKHCELHALELRERCGWCQSPLTVQRALLVTAGPTNGVPSLAVCATCGMALTDGEADEHSYESDEAGHEWTQIVAQLRQGYLDRNFQLELDLTPYAKRLVPSGVKASEPEKEPPVWFDLCINRKSAEQHTFYLGGGRQHPDFPKSGGAQRTQKWSDGLRASDRRRLANALQIIRGERNRNRLLGLHPPRQQEELY